MWDTTEQFIRDAFERWNAGERDPDPGIFHPKMEVYSTLAGSVFRGYDGLREWAREIDEHFDRWHLDIEAVDPLAEGVVIVTGTVQMRGRGSGVDLDQPEAWLLELRDGRLRRMRTFVDRSAGQAAATEIISGGEGR